MKSLDQDSFLLKQTITRSPLITNIYPNFKINLNKKHINSTSIDHENLLSLQNWNELSQNVNTDSYDFDNDDFDVDELLEITKPKAADSEEEQSTTVTIDILMKDSSFSINNLDNNFNLPYVVRSSCHLINEDDDDTLLVSLKTGFLLLIKFFQIGNSIRPMVIQDINLRQSYAVMGFYHSQLSTLGRGLYYKDGIIAITAQSSNIKFCLVDSANSKITNSVNFFIDGQLLMSCFISINTNHLMFLTLIITSMGKLQFRLFEKWNDENLDQISQYSPILLSSDFKIPTYLASINDLVILIYENSITLLGLNYLISYDLNDCQTHSVFSTPSKISCFHIPASTISQENEVLVATNTGAIYSIGIVSLNKIEISLIYELQSQPFVTSFAIYPTSFGFKLIYSTDSTSSEIINLDHSLTKLESEKLSNWAPLIDYCTIKTKYNEEELWVLGNKNKKTSLYQLHKGYKLTTSINDTFFKNAEQIFQLQIGGLYYFMFDFLNHCSLYKFTNNSELQLVELDELEFSAKTLSFNNVTETIALHITNSSITLYDFHEHIPVVNYRIDKVIIMSDSALSTIAIIFHDNDELTLEILSYQDSQLSSIYKLSLESLQPSMLKFYEYDDVLYLTVGFFNNDLICIDVNEKQIISAMSLTNSEPEFVVPHDLIMVDDTMVISSRNGYYGIINQDNLSMGKFIKASDTPIKLFKQSESEFLLLSKSIFKVSLKRSSYPQACYFSSAYSNSKVNDLVYLKGSNEIITVGTGGLNISSLGVDSNSIVVNRRIKLFKNAKRVFDSQALKIFIVIIGSKFKLELESEPLMFISQVTRKKLKLIDSRILDDDEVIITLDDWRFEYLNDKGEHKCHLQLLVSCFNMNSKKSCIKVVELKKINVEELCLTKLFQWNCSHQTTEDVDNKVNFIKQFSNDIIVYCLDNEVYKIHYNFQQKKFEKPELITSSKANINSLSIAKDLVVLTTANDSFVILKHVQETNEFKMFYNDVMWTDIYNNLVLEENLILIDKYDTILKIFNINDLTQFPIVYKTDSLAKLAKCQFSTKWNQQEQEPRTRFIACSLNGEISIFTLLKGEVFNKLQNLINDKKVAKLYDLNYVDEWHINNNKTARVIECDRIDDLEFEVNDYDDELDQILNGIMV